MAVAKATKKRTNLTSERRGVERSDANDEEGSWRRNTARAQGGRTARLGKDTRKEQRGPEGQGETIGQHQARAPDGGKAKPLRAEEPKQKIRKLRHRGPGEGMALRMPPTPCNTLETAGGPRRGPPSETSLGGNRHQR